MSDFNKLCENFGKKRIETVIHNRLNPDDRIDWWKSENEYPFSLNPARPFWIEYVVKSFEAELGFFVDILGLIPNAISENYAVLSNPKNDFFFGFWKDSEIKRQTQPESITIGFLIDEIEKKYRELEERGVQFFHKPKGYPKNNDPLLVCKLETPNKIPIELWGMKE